MITIPNTYKFVPRNDGTNSIGSNSTSSKGSPGKACKKSRRTADGSEPIKSSKVNTSVAILTARCRLINYIFIPVQTHFVPLAMFVLPHFNPWIEETYIFQSGTT